MTQQAGKWFPMQPGDGVISSSRINDIAAGVESLRRFQGPGVRDVGNFALEEVERDLFVAELLDVVWDGGSDEEDEESGSGSGGGTGGWKYSWIERFPGPLGFGYIAGEYAREGSFDKHPAYPMNDRKVAVGTLVWMREKSFTLRTDVDYEMVYEFLDPFEDTAVGSGSGADETGATVYKTECFGGYNVRYESTLSIVGGSLIQSGWELESIQGCCRCCCTESGSGDGGSGGLSYCLCSDVESVPDAWRVGFTTITDSPGCGGCDLLPLEYVLGKQFGVPNSNACSWSCANIGAGDDGCSGVYLDCTTQEFCIYLTLVTSDDVVVLTVSLSPIPCTDAAISEVQYTCPADDWNCNSTNLMTRNPMTPGLYCIWPDEIVLIPE